MSILTDFLALYSLTRCAFLSLSGFSLSFSSCVVKICEWLMLSVFYRDEKRTPCSICSKSHKMCFVPSELFFLFLNHFFIVSIYLFLIRFLNSYLSAVSLYCSGHSSMGSSGVSLLCSYGLSYPLSSQHSIFYIPYSVWCFLRYFLCCPAFS